jgi:molybdopterin synthase catalytic subunit
LVDGELDTAAIVKKVASPARGAVLVFEGRVRDSHQGRGVTHLTYEAYRPMAVGRLAAIVEDLEAAFPGLAAALYHRLGEVPAGEPSVVIAVASPHRDAAYEASRQALERLKAEVPIWKQEHFADGTASWRESEPLGPGEEAPSARS